MGLFDKIFPKRPGQKSINEYFQSINAYTPAFRSFAGSIYEMELTRAAIHRFATDCAKLKPEVVGSAGRRLTNTLLFKPNPYMDTYKFIYRLATILSVTTTAFILPLYAEDYETIIGYYPLLPGGVEIIEHKSDMYLRYKFSDGTKAAIEFERVGVLTQHQFKSDFFGDGNEALRPTMSLLDIQKQGMEEAVKQSAIIRFIARIGQVQRDDDIKKERERFSKENLSADNKSGILMFDNKYLEVKQVDSKPFVVDAEQMKLIQTNVYNYFGVNEKILQNSYDESEWNAFYEGKIEPFALQLGLVLTNMTFTAHERAHGNSIMLSSNRLQYASNRTKLQVSTQLFDRGILTTNQIMDIWNLPHVEDGDKRYIRKEYAEAQDLGKGDDDGNNKNDGAADAGDGDAVRPADGKNAKED